MVETVLPTAEYNQASFYINGQKVVFLSLTYSNEISEKNCPGGDSVWNVRDNNGTILFSYADQLGHLLYQFYRQEETCP